MKIGIEAERANNPVKTGVEHYAKELILQFSKLNNQDEFILYLRTEPEEWIKQLPKNFSYKVMWFPFFWTQLRLSWEMLRRSPDVLFIPASSMPLIHPRRTVVTVHDLAFMFYPGTYTAFMRYYHMFEDVMVSQMAWKIIAVSESTKKDFVNFWKVNGKRISVVYHGYSSIKYEPRNMSQENLHVIPEATSEFASVGHPESTYLKTGSWISAKPVSEMILQSGVKLPGKFVLFLSTLQPRKNLEGLIDAFRLFKQRNPSETHKLVVAGRVGWKAENILVQIERNKDFVVYLNHVSDADRSILYQKASALCVPSFYEGFGMWILEAFDAGVPVMTSNASSMPEVGGDACEYCDPKSVDSIAKALENILLDKKRVADLVSRGKERLKDFSWEKCAQETLNILKHKV